MKKILGLLMCLSLMLVGCSTSNTSELKIMSPNGAPALSLLSVYNDVNEKGEVKIVEGSDMLQSELVKKDGTYDVIIAPINLGCKLISGGQSDYRLAGVVTWGNLYIVENTDLTDNSMAAFGETAVPGRIFSIIKEKSSVAKDATVTYYNAVSDVQAQMLAGKVHYGLMAEPAATATIAKAKQNNMNLTIKEDLQELYASGVGYPQAALFVKEGVDISDLTKQMTELSSLSNDEKSTLLEEIGAKTFGMPSNDIILNTWDRLNVRYSDASEVKEEITSLLKEFNITYSDDMLVS